MPIDHASSRTHRLLLLIAILQATMLAVQLGGRAIGRGPAPAQAAEPFPNALAQRERMITDLKAIHAAVEKLDHRFADSPIQVRLESDDAQQ